MIKIVDCIIFYNELDMLEFRLDYLKDIADFFVIVEATKTHVGKEKPLYLKDNLDRFKRHLDKIVLVECDDLSDFVPGSSDLPWLNERIHRNCIDKGIDLVNRLHGLDESDAILISDVDEIPDVDTLSDIKERGIEGVHSLLQDLYYYNIGCKVTTRWNFSKVADFKSYLKIGPQEMRMATFAPETKEIERGGWHFSYFGSHEFIRNKIENFSHQEFNRDEIIENIKSRVENREDLFDGRKFEFIEPSENPYLPDGYQRLLFSEI